MANAQVHAAQALDEQEQRLRLRAEFWERERSMRNETDQLREQLTHSVSQNSAIQMQQDVASQVRQNDTDLGQVIAQLADLQERTLDLIQRVVVLENWEAEDPATYGIEEELVPGAPVDVPPSMMFADHRPRLSSPLLRNVVGSPRRFPHVHSPVAGRIVEDSRPTKVLRNT